MNISDFIVKTPSICSGRARINGRRIPVSSIYRWFINGLSPADILAKFEVVTHRSSESCSRPRMQVTMAELGEPIRFRRRGIYGSQRALV